MKLGAIGAVLFVFSKGLDFFKWYVERNKIAPVANGTSGGKPPRGR